CHRLAEQVPSADDRRVFLKKCLATPTTLGAPTPPTNVAMGGEAGARGSPAPVLKPAFDDRALKLIENELILQIGPVARILVRKEAKEAVTLQDLASRLADSIPDDAGRAAFENAVRRLG